MDGRRWPGGLTGEIREGKPFCIGVAVVEGKLQHTLGQNHNSTGQINCF